VRRKRRKEARSSKGMPRVRTRGRSQARLRLGVWAWWSGAVEGVDAGVGDEIIVLMIVSVGIVCVVMIVGGKGVLELPSLTCGPPGAVVMVEKVVGDEDVDGSRAEAVVGSVRQTVRPSNMGFPSVQRGSLAVKTGAICTLKFCIGFGADVLLGADWGADTSVWEADVSNAPTWLFPGEPGLKDGPLVVSTIVRGWRWRGMIGGRKWRS